MQTHADIVLENIRTRRTLPYLKMKTDPISETHLAALLEAANWAPTHKHTEPWRYTLFEGEGRKHISKALGEAYTQFCGEKYNPKKFEKTVGRPLHVPLTIGVSMRPSGKIPEFEEVLEVGCSVQNMHLAAQALGIGLAWSTPGYLDHPIIREVLQVEPGDRCYGFLYLGYPSEPFPQSVRCPVEDKVIRISQ